MILIWNLLTFIQQILFSFELHLSAYLLSSTCLKIKSHIARNPSMKSKIEYWIIKHFSHSKETPEILALKKRLFLSIAPGIPIMALFGLVLWFFELPTFAIVTWLFTGIELIILIAFVFLHSYVKYFAVLNQYFFVLFSFAGVLYFGGILHSGGLVLVGLAGVLQSLYYFKPNQIRYIFAFYLITVVIEALLQPFLKPIPELTPTANLVLFVLHLIVVANNLYTRLSVYINQSIQIKKLETQRLRELDTLKTNFYTNITHEFRTPLTVILGMTNQISSKPGKYLEKGVQLIRKNGIQLLHLVNQMLDLSKLEAKSMQVHLNQQDIIPFLRRTTEPFSYLSKEKNINFNFHSDIEELWMDFDPEKMESLIGNLLSNAIKYSPSGSYVDFIVLEYSDYILENIPGFSPFQEKNELSRKILKLTVKDNGQGISEKELPLIFNRYYQVNDKNHHHKEGAGIGLLLVKEIVHILNGNLFVESEPGKGTSFSVFLPIANEADKTRIHEKTSGFGITDSVPLEDKVDNWQLNKDLPHLLIIEDNDDVVTFLRSIVETTYQVDLARNGEEGIKMAMELIPDIILSDVMMPGKDGYDVCTTLKKNFRTNHIPIILLTAKANTESKIKGLEYGADAYLTKPFDSKELMIQMQMLIKSREKLKSKYLTLAITTTDEAIEPVNLDELFLKKLKEILEEKHNDENFDTNQLTLKMGMSRVQLFRKLKALTGISASHFIRFFRLSVAKEKILKTKLTISEISYDVGFKDPAYFTRAFSKEFGFTPTSLRN